MFRAEAYQRLLSDPLPEYRNLEHHTQGLEEEGPNDRVFIQAEEGRAHGIELFAKGTTGSWLVWAASYALSRTEEKIDEEWVPRPFDQRHAINLQLTLRPLPHWSFSMGWIYHSPWPCTSKTFSLGWTVNGYSYVTGEFGPMNQERLIPYHRIDFRVSRDFPLRKGNLLVYLDVFNATNRLNAQSPAYSVTIQGDTFFVEPTIHPQLEMMPSLGLRWVF
ncbi:MAG: hypothetical protein KAJ42_15545 [Gemmatimonadetes bacterium]|nr:hypothetical protein [Gemmatimonadota bacterium]